jgi:hypothetical protein
MKKLILAGSLAALMLTGAAVVYAHSDRHSKKHPNLASAMKLTDEAYEKIEAAQKANEFDLDGHAEKAKDLLAQVNKELDASAEELNEKH